MEELGDRNFETELKVCNKYRTVNTGRRAVGVGLSVLMFSLTIIGIIPRAYGLSSPNWSGYVDTATARHKFTYASGTFVVPDLNGEPLPFGIEFWVGIGSVVGNIWQAGVEVCRSTAAAACFPGASAGTVYYRTWYQNYSDANPNAVVYQSPSASNVGPGDTIKITVSQQKPFRNNIWQVNLTANGSTIVNKSVQLTYPPDQSQAEWIVESHAGIPLPNFGTVTFTNVQAGLDGKTPGPGGSFNPTDFEIVNDVNNTTITYTTVSAWSAGGASFGDTYNVQIAGAGVFPPRILQTALIWRNGVLTDLGTLPGGSTSLAFAINGLGQIVGYGDCTDCIDSYHAFIWRNGTMTDLGGVGSDKYYQTLAFDINNVGQVVGLYESVDITGVTFGPIRAFFWQAGTIVLLPDLCPTDNAANRASAAEHINDLGQVLGNSSICFASGGGQHFVLWQNGAITDLGAGFSASGINNLGQVAGTAGTQAAIWQSGALTYLTIPGCTYSNAIGINDRGQVAVKANCGGFSRAFIWENGATTDLGTLGGNTAPISINGQGQVVGISFDDTGQQHGFLWQNGRMQDLGIWTPGSGNSIH